MPRRERFSFSHAISRMLSIASVFALSINAQVFIITTSASVSSAVMLYPASFSR